MIPELRKHTGADYGFSLFGCPMIIIRDEDLEASINIEDVILHNSCNGQSLSGLEINRLATKE